MQLPTLPVISLAAHPDTASLAVELGRACREEGFIYLSDHGIPAELTDEAFGISERYFADARPEDKVDLKENTGYTAVRQESLDPSRASGDLKECFHFANSDWQEAHGKPQKLPSSLEPDRPTIDRFIHEINRVAARILHGLAVALRLPEDYLVKQHRGEHNRLRLLHYPPAALSRNDSSPDIRAGAHTDYGSITLLFQHRVSGLQVRRGDDWMDVPPRSGCLVINIGDALEFWSGGRFKSTLHRVVMPREQAETSSRYSIAYFVHPDTDSILDPFVDEHNAELLDQLLVRKGLPRGTRRIRGNDYVQARLQATYAVKAN
ncbi:hypothetical protein DB88DRAFT_122997 [Papiliotrema laurentii]|uniref:Fe2OG dioxygenase domain-containing protein n=1 Tax=Papiliotrema laurentii TaxID=5418 RepID=A0AAD9CVE0_PAPLA|nr:hypothetical protein DB88DRAFT_122997 [Papiliotrema laurentii]